MINEISENAITFLEHTDGVANEHPAELTSQHVVHGLHVPRDAAYPDDEAPLAPGNPVTLDPPHPSGQVRTGKLREFTRAGQEDHYRIPTLEQRNSARPESYQASGSDATPGHTGSQHVVNVLSADKFFNHRDIQFSPAFFGKVKAKDEPMVREETPSPKRKNLDYDPHHRSYMPAANPADRKRERLHEEFTASGAFPESCYHAYGTFHPNNFSAAAAEEPNQYLLTLIDPRVSGVRPDITQMGQTTRKSVHFRNTTNAEGPASYLYVYLPNVRRPQIRVYIFCAGAAYVYWKTIYPDEDISLLYSKASNVSGMIQIQCSSVNNTDSGQITSVCVNQLPQITLGALTPDSVSSYGNDAKDSRVYVKPTDGVVNVMRPDGDGSLFQVDTPTTRTLEEETFVSYRKPNSSAAGNGWINMDGMGPGSTVFDTNNIVGAWAPRDPYGWLDLDYSVSTTPTGTNAVSLQLIVTTRSCNAAGVAADLDTSYGNTSTQSVIGQVNRLADRRIIFSDAEVVRVRIVYTGPNNGVWGGSNADQNYINLRFQTVGAQGVEGPAHMTAVTGLVTSPSPSNILVSGIHNFEVVPNATLSRDVKLRYDPAKGGANEEDAARLALSAQNALSFVYTASEYAELRASGYFFKVAQVADMHHFEASGASRWFKKAGDWFGRQGKALGRMILPVVENSANLAGRNFVGTLAESALQRVGHTASGAGGPETFTASGVPPELSTMMAEMKAMMDRMKALEAENSALRNRPAGLRTINNNSRTLGFSELRKEAAKLLPQQAADYLGYNEFQSAVEVDESKVTSYARFPVAGNAGSTLVLTIFFSKAPGPSEYHPGIPIDDTVLYIDKLAQDATAIDQITRAFLQSYFRFMTGPTYVSIDSPNETPFSGPSVGLAAYMAGQLVKTDRAIYTGTVGEQGGDAPLIEKLPEKAATLLDGSDGNTLLIACHLNNPESQMARTRKVLAKIRENDSYIRPGCAFWRARASTRDAVQVWVIEEPEEAIAISLAAFLSAKRHQDGPASSNDERSIQMMQQAVEKAKSSFSEPIAVQVGGEIKMWNDRIPIEILSDLTAADYDILRSVTISRETVENALNGLQDFIADPKVREMKPKAREKAFKLAAQIVNKLTKEKAPKKQVQNQPSKSKIGGVKTLSTSRFASLLE